MIKQKLLPPLTSVNQGGRKEVGTVAREKEEEGERGEAVAQVEATLQRRQSVGQVKVYKPAKKAGRQTRQRLLRLLSNFFCAVARCPLQHKHTQHTPHNKAEHKKARHAGEEGELK